MNVLEFGDIVLLQFPYTNLKKVKKRPALVVNDYSDGDIIVCRITSQIYKSKSDIYINNWEEKGLKLPSVIRVHKMATLEKKLVIDCLGEIDEDEKNQVKVLISRLPE